MTSIVSKIKSFFSGIAGLFSASPKKSNPVLEISEEQQSIKLLIKALKSDTFHFIAIEKNDYQYYISIHSALYDHFANPDKYIIKSLTEVRMRGKSYRQIVDELDAALSGIVLVPDFDWLLIDNEESIAACVAFNQRRDHFAKKSQSLVVFCDPYFAKRLLQKLPDWWSIRSLELVFHREHSRQPAFSPKAPPPLPQSLSDNHPKKIELAQLYQQLKDADPENKNLLYLLFDQIAKLLFSISHFQEAQIYWEQALIISRDTSNIEDEGSVLGNLGLIYYYLGDRSKAIDHYNQALIICNKTDDHLNYVGLLLNLGVVYKDLGDFSKAIEYNNQALIIFRKTHNRIGESKVLGNLGIIYSNLHDRFKAIEYLNKSLIICSETDNRIGENNALSNLGVIYKDLGESSKAIDYFNKSLIINRDIGYRRGEAISLSNLGSTYSDVNDNSRAIAFYNDALSIYIETGSIREKGEVFGNLGIAYEKLGNLTKAIEYYQLALNIHRETGNRYGEGNVLNNFGEFYHMSKNTSKAIEYFQQALKIFEEIGSPEAERVRKNLEIASA